MQPSRIESLTLVAAVIGAAMLGSQGMAIGFGAAAVGDLAILLALFTFDGSAARSGAESLAFAAASGFCLLTPLFFVAYTVLGASVPMPQLPAGVAPKAIPSSWLIFGTWFVATLIMFAVDRFRMSSRESVGLGEAGLSAAPIKPITVSSPVSSYRPAPIRMEEAVAQPVKQPAYVPPPPPSYNPPPPPPPAFVPQPVPDFSATTIAAPAAAPAAPVVASQPTAPVIPDVLAIPAGREAIIYLNLVGEGLNVLRTVRAENLGRDYYRIADVMPEGEQWEFTPGQVVRCRKKSLSNGKHMVAFEEAPRA